MFGQEPQVPDACSLPFDGGPCEAYVPVFAFDAAEGICVEKIYGGCGGNDNSFQSLSSCQATCGESKVKLI